MSIYGRADLGPMRGPLGVKEGLVEPMPPPSMMASMQQLLRSILLSRDLRVLDTIGCGNSVQLKVPGGAAALQGSIQTTPVAETASVKFTNVLECKARNESSPVVMTLSLNPTLERLTATSAIDQYDVKALVEWGTNGSLQRAFIDVTAGVEIVILGSYLRVTGVYTGLNLGTPLPGGPFLPPVTLSAGVSYGARGGAATPPVWTGIVVQPPAAAASSIDVPPFANDVQVYAINRVTGASAAVTITMRTGLVVPDGIKFNTTQPANSFPIYRIPGDTVFLDVSHGEVNACNIVVVFGLAL